MAFRYFLSIPSRFKFPKSIFRDGKLLIALTICMLPLTTALCDEGFDPLPILARMDRNHDGILDPAEIPFAARKFVTEILEQCNLELNEPIKLDLVEIGWQVGGNKSETSARSPDATPESAARNAYNLVLSFDRNGDKVLQSEEWEQFAEPWKAIDSNQNGEITVAEMAVQLFQESRPRKDEAEDVDRSDELPKKTVARLQELAAMHVLNPDSAQIKPIVTHRDKKSESEQTAEYVYTLLKRYDVDDDDLLDRTEIGELGGDWLSADIDRDGKVSLDEMTVRFRTLQSGESRKTNLTKKRTGILQDLPEVFFELDANGDHQIQMHEYSSEWSDAKVAEFLGYDTNEDYLITPREWLEFEIREKGSLNRGGDK